jgi:hypothetical protein
MMLTGENQGTVRKTISCANLSITDPTWTGVKLNACLRGDRYAINRLSHLKAQCLIVHLFCSLPYDRSIATSKGSSPRSAMWCYLCE